MHRPALLLAVAVAALALGCPEVPAPPQPPPAPPAPSATAVAWHKSKNGLGFRLGDADARDDRPVPRPAATPLSDADAQRVLARLPPLAADPDDEKGFALRDKSQPPPRTGKTVTAAFPPPEPPRPPPPASAGAPPVVTRRAPVGPVDLAPALTVSFSTPMVAVTSHDDLAGAPPPITLTPTPPGKWRWAGSQTVIFDPKKRFPMATDYTVEVPAGTRAVNGQATAQAERWTFSTPPPRLLQSHPHDGPVGLDPVMYVELDQAVDAREVIQRIDVRAGGTKIAVRAASDEEIEADPVVRKLVAKAEPGRFVAFKASEGLRPGMTLDVTLPAGLPSAEGPKRTEKDQRFRFFTYRPLAIARARCGWGPCTPGETWTIEMNNPLDLARFDRAQVRIEPEVAAKIGVSGSNVIITPRSRGKTKYKITLVSALADAFGQTLGADATAEIGVERAVPFLFPEENEMSVLDPAGGPALPVFSVNRPTLTARIYAVDPEDFDRYRAWRAAWDDEAKDTPPPGRLVASRAIRTANRPDELVETPIDLSPALRDGLGQALVIVEPPGPRPRRGRQRQWVRAWVQATRLGVDVFADGEELTAWTTRLADGAPEAGVEVTVLPWKGSGVKNPPKVSAASGADGLARAGIGAFIPGAVVARRGGDLALLPERDAYERSFLTGHRADEIRWLLFDDRHVYKPGEELRVKGWLRRAGMHKGGDIDALPGAAGAKVSWLVHDAMRVELGKGTSDVDASGGFDLAFTLPATPNLGDADIRFTFEGPAPALGGTIVHHAFDIEEFRRPEFEVGARAGEGPFFVGGHTTVTASATYYAGGGLPSADVAWRVTREDAVFVPPNRGDFVFGKAQESWWEDRRTKKEGEEETWSGRTSAAGEHRVRVDFDAVDPPYPMSLAFEATITDVNRQAWTARTTALVHPADVYVGVRQERAFVKAGETFAADVLVTDIDGKPVAGRPVVVTSARIDWKLEQGKWVEEKAEVGRCALTSAAEAARCALPTKQGGQYELAAVVTDASGRRNRTETHVWVTGEGAPKDRTLEQGVVKIVPSKTSYQPGETAELLVVAPFAPAEGVMTVERQGIVHLERFRLDTEMGTLRLPIDAGWTPNLSVRVALAGAAPREDARGEPDPKLPKRPAFATGTAAIAVPLLARKLAVTAKPRDAKIEPGGATVVDVEVRDAQGAPVANGTAAVVVVDEAVLALSGYVTPDPMAVFYAPRDADAVAVASRERVLVSHMDGKRILAAREQDHDGDGIPDASDRLDERFTASYGYEFARAAPSAAPMGGPLNKEIEIAGKHAAIGGKAEPEKAPAPIAVRKDFAALAHFTPAVATDAVGRASVAVKLPDSLTRYRVMAVAVAGERQFGAGESSITARLPLMVRPSAPRFLNYGDRFELPIVIQNQTDAPMDVDVAARASNALLTGGAGRRVTVPAGDRVEVRLPAAAAKPGKARFQIGAASGRWADAAAVDLPVWTPATTEAFATYGTIDEGAAAQPVKVPSDVAPGYGGLAITTSSTAVSALTDAVHYLVAYPFECNEQIASRVMAIAALRDVLAAFDAPGLPPRDALVAAVGHDVEHLAARQQPSGGWAFWQLDADAVPYLSVHVAHALQRAKEKGFAVPAATLARARDYLRVIERHIPAWYTPASRRAILAYALYVRRRMGDADPARARHLVEEGGGPERVELDALGWVWPTIADDPASSAILAGLRRHVENRVTETAGAAHFATSYEDGAYVLLDSDRRADGVLLEALIGDQPQSDLIPKLVAGLLGHTTAGHWASTQENAFVLLALDRYFATYEKATPDFVARAWLGDRYAGEHAFKGRTTDRREVMIPMRALAEIGGGDVVVQKDGPGRLYYRVGLVYAPADLRPLPVEHGFSVSRAYEHVDDPAEVRRDPDGTWRVKAGAKVRVRVTMVAPTRRYHVALVDPLPAGLEVMNPALAVTGSVPEDPRAAPGDTPWWWTRPWYDHQEMRDERVEAFTPLLWEGVYEYTYVARATTPGVFVVPPPRAEEMYSPETFGRGPGDRLVVE
jgi:uncharacterized protein YfaS (alpha-2-macroglobulin family)